jgi:structural maintenance of chromosome 2
VDKVKKAEENLGKKTKDAEGQREEVERGGRELEGMEGEVAEIKAKREKVSFVAFSHHPS